MTIYKPYDPDQPYLLPPILQEWLPESHLANFIHEMVGELDLGAIHKKYLKRKRDGRGQKPFDPGIDGEVVVLRLLHRETVIAKD